jgi:CRISPR-associated exonuclease Cas4
VTPSHRFIVCGDGTRHRIENTDELRAWVLDLAGQIRAARAAVMEPIWVTPTRGQCRPCGMRGHCGQARL